jgi:hypothetical protein
MASVRWVQHESQRSKGHSEPGLSFTTLDAAPLSLWNVQLGTTVHEPGGLLGEQLVLSCALFINAVLYAVPHVLLGVMVWI